MTLKNKEKIYSFWEHFNQTLNKCVLAENNFQFVLVFAKLD